MFSAIGFNKTMPELNDYITTEAAAKAEGVNIKTIYRALSDKSLVGLKVGRTWLVSRASLKIYHQKTTGMNKYDPRRKEQLTT